MYRKERSVLGVIGCTGMGKSRLCKEQIFAIEDRVVVCDTMGEYAGVHSGRAPVGVSISSPAELARYLQRTERFRVAFLPLEESDFDAVCRIVRAKGNLVFIVEEVSQFCTAGQTPVEFRKCIMLGRHASLNMVYTGQRFADIPRKLTAQTQAGYVFFLQTEPGDLVEIDRRFPGLSETVGQLDVGEYVRVKSGRYDGNCTVDRLGGGRGVGDESDRPAYHRSDTGGSDRE
jgi:hypothetical protein